VTGYVLAFGLALLLAVLTSGLASRSPLSTTTVFLAAGMVAGPLGLDIIHASRGTVAEISEVALFAILFVDGQDAPLSVLRQHWRLTSRALFVGMPLTMALIALAAHVIAGLPWLAALTLGAVLAPTDPVFASSLVGRNDVPRPVRHLLNIESGVNDGLALPAVLLLIGLAGGSSGQSTHLGPLLLELLGGVVLGVVLPLAIWLLLRLRHLGATSRLRPLGPFAVAVVLFGLCQLTHANPFLAAFVAGSVISTVQHEASESFRHTGELASEMVKGAALLAFATLLVPGLFSAAGWAGFAFAIVVIVVTRPVPVMAVLARTSLSARQRLSVAWFGPKGFASVVYAAMVAFSDMESADQVLALAAVTVLVSAAAHSSTDLFVAQRLSAEQLRLDPDSPALDVESVEHSAPDRGDAA
jgi:NhaP-type Na+/H+ or K+/H+ antiporter